MATKRPPSVGQWCSADISRACADDAMALFSKLVLIHDDDFGMCENSSVPVSMLRMSQLVINGANRRWHFAVHKAKRSGRIIFMIARLPKLKKAS